MLENKYLKYSPEITLEIFDKIWNKLLSLKIKGKVYDFYPENNLETFKKGGYIWIGPSGQYSFGIDNNYGSLKNTETSVQEILGYDPFREESKLDKWLMETRAKNLSLEELRAFIGSGLFCPYDDVYKKLKGENPYEKAQILLNRWNSKEFELPKYWYVKVTAENLEVLSMWRFDNTLTKLKNGQVVGWSKYSDGKGHNNTVSDFFDTEITFEQFKKYVLKESPIQPSTDPVEKDWDKVTKEELLEEAKRRYPAGIKFKSAYSGDITTSKHPLKNALSGIATSDGMYIYYNRKWAEIIESVKAPTATKDLENYFVTCNTQEEWNFACDKFNRSDNVKGQFPKYDTFNHRFSGWESLDYLKNKYPDGTFLSFQEWCNLKGYKMEYPFKIGTYYYFESYSNLIPNIAQCLDLRNGFNSDNWIMLKNGKTVGAGSWDFNIMRNIREATQEEIQQYLPDGHPDKINSSQIKFTSENGYNPYNFKVGDYLYVLKEGYKGDILQIANIKKEPAFNAIWIEHSNESFSGGGFRFSETCHAYGECIRLATKEEIEDYLKPHQIYDATFDPFYPFNPARSYSGNYTISVDRGKKIHEDFFGISCEKELILSIDDEELPMVNITKTKTISQLLNNN